MNSLIRGKFWRLLLAFLLLGSWSTDQAQLTGTTPFGYRAHSVGVLLSPEDFSESKIKDLASKILEKHTNDTLFKIIFSSDPDEIKWRSWERNEMHWAYEQWRAAFAAESARRMPYAEVWKIRGNVGLALARPSGGPTFDILSGESPFQVRCASANLRILSMVFQQNPSLRLYVESPKMMSEDEARDATACLSRFVHVDDFEAYFGESPWFIADARYPVFNRLARYPDKIPSKTDYLKITRWFCSAGRLPRCIGVGPFN